MKIYCSGIGGSGMSAYAALRAASGDTVLGSDRAESPLVDALREDGISVFLNQDGSALPGDCDVFVYSEAIPEDAPERVRAAELGIRSINYFQALGELSSGYKTIAVCGTHGKSSTVAMAAQVLIEQGLDPTVIVGARTPALNGKNWRKGQTNLFLVEACEYRRDFRFLQPKIVLMTNVEGDHFDYFPSVTDYEDAFVEFLQLLPEDGLVITHGEDDTCRKIAERSGRILVDADRVPLPNLSVSGVHMQQNAQLIVALAEHLELDMQHVADALRAYKGAERRMEFRGTTVHDVPVIDDYAHHPTEITATIQAAQQQFPENRLVVVFQPHTHDRTLKLYDQFCHSFRGADALVVAPVYDARSNTETDSVDMPKFVSDIAEQSDTETFHGESFERIESMLRTEILKKGDVLLVLGAGDITQVSSALV